MAGSDRKTVVLGLLAAPGLTRELADRLADTLPALLSERYPAVDWQVLVSEDQAAAASAARDVDLVGITRRRMLDEGWDLPSA